MQDFCLVQTGASSRPPRRVRLVAQCDYAQYPADSLPRRGSPPVSEWLLVAHSRLLADRAPQYAHQGCQSGCRAHQHGPSELQLVPPNHRVAASGRVHRCHHMLTHQVPGGPDLSCESFLCKSKRRSNSWRRHSSTSRKSSSRSPCIPSVRRKRPSTSTRTRPS